MQDKVVIYGAKWCPDCRRVKQFFGKHMIAYEWVDIEADSKAMAYVKGLNRDGSRVPTLVFPDGTILTDPSDAELSVKLGVKGRAARPFYDVVIVGGGPAGLTAAIYASRDGMDTLILEQAALGGQAATTQVIDNFPGFDAGVSGPEFTVRLRKQAQKYGTEILQGEQIADIRRDGQYLVVSSVNKRDYISRSVLVATGSHYRRLNVPGEQELTGRNVHFCATCDGALYKGKKLLVVGGGNSGFEEGLFLTKFAREITIIENTPSVRASQILQDKVAARADMKVLTQRSIKEFKVNGSSLSGVMVENGETGEVEEWDPDGVFVFIGLRPNTAFLPDTIQKDAWGFIDTDKTLGTTLEGVFAAGDVRAGSTKQAVSAAGEGTTAALMIRQYLQSLGEARSTAAVEKEAFAEG
jgi:thioredoxin reductase (NADPH)